MGRREGEGGGKLIGSQKTKILGDCYPDLPISDMLIADPFDFSASSLPPTFDPRVRPGSLIPRTEQAGHAGRAAFSN